MSRNVDLFFNSSIASFAMLAREIGHILGVQFERTDITGEEAWAASTPPNYYMLCVADCFDNDRDMDFERFRWLLDVDVRWYGATDDDFRHERRIGLGFDVFEKLRATGRYELMLVDDSQRKLAEHRIPIPHAPDEEPGDGFD